MIFLRKINVFSFLNSIRNRLFSYAILKINKKKKYLNIYDDLYVSNFEISELKKEIVNYYLENIRLNKSFRDHLFNTLFISDSNIHNKACLIHYLLDKKLKIDKISAPFLSKRDRALFLKFNLNIKEINVRKLNFNPVLMFLWIIYKKYRFYNEKKHFPESKSRFDRNIKYTRIVKAWHDYSENIYLNKLKQTLENAIIFIVPHHRGQFPSKRQLEYLDFLKTKKRNYFFYIPKVNYFKVLNKAIRIYLTQFPEEIKFSLLEVMIQRLEINDLILYLNQKFPNIQEFYTKEEFSTDTTYLSEKLKTSKIKVINYSHGVGLFCPIVNYDEFYVVSQMQKNYYSGSSKFKYFELNPSLSRMEAAPNRELKIFFIGQELYSNKASKNIIISYTKTIEFIEEIAAENKDFVFAKYHPNSTEKDKILSSNIQIIDRIDDLPKDFNYLAITFFSAFVIDLLDSMPFLIINPENRLDMRFIFPTDDFFYVNTYQEFNEIIEKLKKDNNYYNKYWGKQISVMKEKMS